MAAARLAAGTGLVKLPPVTFVTGNAKKLEEVKVILGQSIPFQSLKLDCMYIIQLLLPNNLRSAIELSGSLIDRFAN